LRGPLGKDHTTAVDDATRRAETPNPQNYLGTVDFSRGKIRDAIEPGRNDAAGARFE
jgi:hypothetical protein